MREIVCLDDASPRGVDTAFSRIRDSVARWCRVTPRERPIGTLRGERGRQAPVRSGRELPRRPAVGFPGAGGESRVRETPAAETALSVRGGLRAGIDRTCEKVLDWLRENRYEKPGTPREAIFVAPGARGSGPRNGGATGTSVPIREASRRGAAGA